MNSNPLASCQIIPQQVSVSIDGGVHFDGLTVVIVIVLWIMVRKKL